MDGDRANDVVYHGSGSKLGVYTAKGIRSEADVPTAKTFAVKGAADANDDGKDELFVTITAATPERNVGAYVLIAEFVGCDLRLLRNAEDTTYKFRLGNGGTVRDGVGCVDTDGDGKKDLVGLHGENGPNNSVRWSRTVVRISGDRAINGPTDGGVFHYPEDSKAIDSLSDLSCGTNPLDSDYGA